MKLNCIFYFIILQLVLVTNCDQSSDTITSNIPIEINKRMIISEDCDMIIYSSNGGNYYSPVVISGFFSGKAVTKKLKIKKKSNLFAQSVSCDCRLISIVEENTKTNTFDLLVYDVAEEKLRNITDTENVDEGNSMFSPQEKKLAYLEDHKLKLLDYKDYETISIDNPSYVDFRELIWSHLGKHIYLEDYAADIWRYDIKDQRFDLIWESSKASYIDNRMITPSADSEEEFYFISDHESQFTQIYKYSPNSHIKAIVKSNHDKFLLQRPIKNGVLYYRTNVDGHYVVKKTNRDEMENIYPYKGVVYDYYNHPKFGNLFLYSNNKYPASIFNENNKTLKNLINIGPIDPMISPKVLYNRKGAINLLYYPKVKPKGWVLWLHGGPYEQMSIRYNIYLSSLLKFGWGLIVLNYPGSTGIGNDYEMRGREENMLFDQICTIREDLLDIKKIHPDIKKYALVGVSYGSILAQSYSEKYSEDISLIIDFSGLVDLDYPGNTPLLYIYGENDFSLENPSRVKLIENNLKNENTSELTLADEGHIINRRESIIKTINKLHSFLSNYE